MPHLIFSCGGSLAPKSAPAGPPAAPRHHARREVSKKLLCTTHARRRTLCSSSLEPAEQQTRRREAVGAGSRGGGRRWGGGARGGTLRGAPGRPGMGPGTRASTAAWRDNLLTSSQAAEALAKAARRVAVLGIKPESRAEQPAHHVPKYLQEQGVAIVPVPTYVRDTSHHHGEVASHSRLSHRALPDRPSCSPFRCQYPDVTEILGVPVERDLGRLNGREIDILNVFRKPADVGGHVEDILRLKPKAVWLQVRASERTACGARLTSSFSAAGHPGTRGRGALRPRRDPGRRRPLLADRPPERRRPRGAGLRRRRPQDVTRRRL